MLMLGKTRLEQLGLRVAIGKHVLAEYGYLAGSDQRAAAGPRGGLPRSAASRRSSARAAATGCRGCSPGSTRRSPGATRRRSSASRTSPCSTSRCRRPASCRSGGRCRARASGGRAFSVRSLERALMSGEPVGRASVLEGTSADDAAAGDRGGAADRRHAQPADGQPRHGLRGRDARPNRLPRGRGRGAVPGGPHADAADRGGEAVGRRRRGARHLHRRPKCGTRPGRRSLTMQRGVRGPPAAA